MIRVLAHHPDGRPIVLLGLSAENVVRLTHKTNDQPIHLNLKRLDPNGDETDLPDIDLVIFYESDKNVKMIQTQYRA